MILVKSFSLPDKSMAEQAFAIRRAVFVEEQGIDSGLEYDHEAEAHHYLALLDGKPIATARWRETETGIKLERFAVLAAFRRRGVGAQLLHVVLQEVTPAGKIIYLHAQLRAVPFYERHGFCKVGPQFNEADLAHYKMQYSGL